MYSLCSSAAPHQLHATLPGRNGTQACLTLSDVCPHTSRSRDSSVRCKIPYLYHNQPSVPSTPPIRTIEYVDNSGRKFVETARTALSPLSEPRRIYATECIDNKGRDMNEMSRKVPPLHHPKEKGMTASLARLVLSKNSPTMHHIRESTAPPSRSIFGQPSTMPTVYLVSFSTDRTPTTRSYAALLNEHLPLRVPLQYTIDARSFLVPPKRLCESYSGVAGLVQGEVLRDYRARKEIDHAVDELTSFVKQGGHEIAVAVCCTAGTHRSVAIAELIALGVRKEVRRLGSREGVKVVVRHVHRIKGPKDPY